MRTTKPKTTIKANDRDAKAKPTYDNRLCEGAVVTGEPWRDGLACCTRNKGDELRVTLRVSTQLGKVSGGGGP